MSPLLLTLCVYGTALLGGVGALVLDAFARRSWAVAVAAVGLALAGGISLWGATLPMGGAFDAAKAGGPFSAVPGVIMVLAAVTLLGGWREFVGRPGGGAAAALVALAATSSGAVAASFDLIFLLVALETTAAAGYALVADARTARSDEASMKYFVQGAVATGFLVFGIAVLVSIFAPGGTYAELNSSLQTPVSLTAALAGAMLVLAALAFKSSIVPFHSWAPDAYETARPEVSAFLAGGPKLAAISAFAVFFAVCSSGELARELIVPIAALSVVSVLVGSLGALKQRSYTRMLAYAGIAQAGYALVGVVSLNPATALFFGSTYAIGTTGAFLAAAAFRQHDPDWDGTIEGLAGMGRRAPLVAGGLALLLISLAGIPPLLGFWGKLQVFGSAIVASQIAFASGSQAVAAWTYAIVAVAGVVGSVISLGYYGRVLRAMYFDEPAVAPDDGPAATGIGPAGWSVVGLSVAVVLLGLVPLVMGSTYLVLPFTFR